MTIFDLLFVAVFLGTLICLSSILYQLLRGRRRPAGRLAFALGMCWALYMLVVVAVSLFTPQRVVTAEQGQCFDDWCLAVGENHLAASIGQTPNAATAKGTFYVVGIRVFSRARRVSQSAPDADVYLQDREGRVFEVSREGQKAYEAAFGAALPLGTRLEPSGSFVTTRVFDVPSAARDVGLVTLHGAGPGPGWFVIGDDSSFFHKRTLIRLPPPAE